MSHPSQFDLFKTRRFLPLFVTQFLGAFNDNLFKNAMIVLISFHGLSAAGLSASTMVNAAAGIFILPFFLFSALSGDISERMDKAKLAQYIKLMEVGIMLLAGAGFYWHSPILLLTCLFLMGVHSTLFGPLKYSVLPQYLKPTELIGGNGLIEMGTFVAILIGQIAGTMIIQAPNGDHYIVLACVGFAILGYIASKQMPAAPATADSISVKINFIAETWKIIQQTRQNRTVFLSILGISWFWFFGAVYLTQLPHYASQVLVGDAGVYTLLITLFSIGVGVGSVLCEKLSGRVVELGLVPFGSIGLSLFGIDLFFATPQPNAATTLTVNALLNQSQYYRTLVDILGMGVFGGFFIVPLYALIQLRSEPNFRSRAIAANNVMNSLFMVVAAGVSGVLLANGVSIPELLLIVSIMNILVALYIYTVIPEFLMRFLVWIVTHTMYRVRHEGLDNIPESGPCVLVCNHASFMDPLIIAGASRRPVRFVMDHQIFRIPVLNFIFKTAKAVPIAPTKEVPGMKEQAFQQVAKLLQEGEVVCIFPEGKITYDGELNTFKLGIEEIIATTPVPVIPMALRGMWGSFFSRRGGPAMKRIPNRFWSKVDLVAGKPIAAQDVSAQDLQLRVQALRGTDRK